MDGSGEVHVGHVESPGAAALAVLLMLLAFVAAVAAVRGTYLTVWETLKPGGGTSGAAGGTSTPGAIDTGTGSVGSALKGVHLPAQNPTLA